MFHILSLYITLSISIINLVLYSETKVLIKAYDGGLLGPTCIPHIVLYLANCRLAGQDQHESYINNFFLKLRKG